MVETSGSGKWGEQLLRWTDGIMGDREKRRRETGRSQESSVLLLPIGNLFLSLIKLRVENQENDARPWLITCEKNGVPFGF